jgi:hypothetical protein
MEESITDVSEGRKDVEIRSARNFLQERGTDDLVGRTVAEPEPSCAFETFSRKQCTSFSGIFIATFLMHAAAAVSQLSIILVVITTRERALHSRCTIALSTCRAPLSSLSLSVPSLTTKLCQHGALRLRPSFDCTLRFVCMCLYRYAAFLSNV